jgi:hypothetical protein
LTEFAIAGSPSGEGDAETEAENVDPEAVADDVESTVEEHAAVAK